MLNKTVVIVAVAVASTLGALGTSHAQQKEVFHGSELRTAHGAGVLVSTSRRGSGEEILRIRASRESAASFLGRTLPEQLQGGRSINYTFTLQVAPPLFRRKECRSTAESRETFEACFSANTAQLIGSWSIVPLPTLVEGQGNIGLKTTLDGEVFARCGTLPVERVILSCDIYFEQGGHWHELNTSSVAPDHIQQVRCAALELRNAIWAEGPKITEECRN